LTQGPLPAVERMAAAGPVVRKLLWCAWLARYDPVLLSRAMQ
jgi:hypothetical protein